MKILCKYRIRESFAILFAVVMVAAFVLIPISAQAGFTQDQIKVAMIRKFVEFVKWPEDVSPRKTMNVKICSYGNSQLGTAADMLEKKLPSQTVRYTFPQLTSGEDIGSKCHIIFISNQDQDRFPSIMAALKGKAVLTVGDINNFVDRGGMIGFVSVDGKMKYDINNQAFGPSGLKVDAQLLETANRVVE